MQKLSAFTYLANPSRVIFGSGSRHALGAELERLSVKRAMVVSTAEQHADARLATTSAAATIGTFFPGAVMHTPSERTTEAFAHLSQADCDGLVSYGGGSATGLGKALALRSGLPLLAIPTTYAGSEVTPILGETINNNKTTQRNAGVLPATVIYDVDLTLGLPIPLSLASGLNAIAHAVEALYAPDSNPVVALMAERGVRLLSDALPLIANAPNDIAGRSAAMEGAWLCGVCLGATRMGLHHRLCHILGGLFDLPHAQLHAIILPYVLAYNANSASPAMESLRAALGDDDPALKLYRLRETLQLPGALSSLGLPEAGLAVAAHEAATADNYANPRKMDAEAILAFLKRAYVGAPPVRS
ncbi:Maleylacetate reductase [Brucella anthropi]|uniref:maleylacetate reductase n=1 Tax=Brucella anthropi TaxID=529 RepID=UPI000451C564|nr:maleylacetate reductase [Brucella anthropi]EXL02472.1 Maleylacetate reductase [Brucella anthropi]